MKYLLSFFLFVFPVFAFGQYYTGTLSENQQIVFTKIDKPLAFARNSPKVLNQLPGFPLAFKSDPNNGNRRNVTLEDINNDDIQDLLFCSSNIFYAYSNNEPLWQKTLIGTGMYPPSVADIDGAVSYTHLTLPTKA